MSQRKPNTVQVDGTTARVDISTPKFPSALTLIDSADLSRVIDGAGRWRCARLGSATPRLYVWRWTLSSTGRPEYTFLHRWLLGLTKGDGLLVDHRNGDALDNHRDNLRLATSSQNNINAERPRTNPFRGISKKPRGLWWAQIRVDGTQRYLGSFETAEAAARSYDAAARTAHGEFAVLNFPDEERAA